MLYGNSSRGYPWCGRRVGARLRKIKAAARSSLNRVQSLLTRRFSCVLTGRVGVLSIVGLAEGVTSLHDYSCHVREVGA